MKADTSVARDDFSSSSSWVFHWILVLTIFARQERLLQFIKNKKESLLQDSNQFQMKLLVEVLVSFSVHTTLISLL